jgi:hypothetical protein
VQVGNLDSGTDTLLQPIGGVMARQPEEVTELRRGLGALLAACLDASPLNQGDLARATNYHRSSISHVTAGRQFPERSFWDTADSVLNANGELVAQYDMVRDQEDQIRKAELDRAQAERHAKVSQLASGLKPHRQEVALYHPSPDLKYPDSASIDLSHVEKIHEDIRTFVKLDQQYGGAAASPVILQAYRQMRHRVDTSEIPDELRRDVHSALSEVAEVAGWSLYDSDNDPLTTQINNEALSLTRLAGDRSMELFVLQNMAMHAETMRRPRGSINISRLVLENDNLSPRLEALFRLRLARAYGQLQADGESRKELDHARSLFQDGLEYSDPHWSWWVNNGQLWWFEGAVRVDLGKCVESVEYFELSANSIPEPRMNFVYRTWALFGYCLNRSWANVEQSLWGLVHDVGIFRSRIAARRLNAAIDLIEVGNAPSTVRDLASALRVALRNAAIYSANSPFGR